jgi:pyruvate,phosphate dikinase
VETDAELNVKSLQKLFDHYRTTYAHAGIKIPDTVNDQLRVCIDAVFRSWNSDRAKEYRKIESIDDSLGTAVTVQAMVFGNMNDKSGSGVLFTREPSTGERKIMAEYLVNAQGEDVVAGIRTPDKLELNNLDVPGQAKKVPAWQTELEALCYKLEVDYRDMVDAEFTVQDGALFILQSRVGKRSARAAFKIAVDLFKEGVINEDEMFERVKRKQLAVIRKPSIDPKFKGKPILTGLGASQGIATGRIAVHSQQAVKMAAEGHKVILVTKETTPEDIAGMAVSAGILTQTGGATSHAAVVARGMDKPCVVGCVAMDLGKMVEGKIISIDGATGRVWEGEVPVVGGELDDGPKEFVDMLLLKHGVFVQTDGPAPNTTVVLADWCALNDTEIKLRVNMLVAASEVGMVVLDITPPHRFGTEDDNPIWQIAGLVPEISDFPEKVLNKVLHADGIIRKNVRVVGGDKNIRELFALKEFYVLTQAATVEELFATSGPCTIAPELVKSIAQNGDVRAFLGKVKDAGLFKGEVLTGSEPAAYAAFRLMKE